ncbi:NmrA family NAD(P)-binding protein [Pararhodobacter zhoushanensis]|uniref:NAD(P)H-binding protein n=1 Tax=Pararhodobacter zhoushanensis TaxID=2479545 RepID=A0ABT3GX65_9RHOB|nr:NAD(P)H-binding protein [Pararhodobacter zhoushanensis]MCW1932098.1 NAD(P)H-binding protein [Pararhodobacter zhoushanensis]
MTQTIAITGATGQLGRLAIAALKTRAPGATLIALVRDPAKAVDLGVDARAFDYTAPATLAAPLKGVDVLVLISSSDFNDRAGQHRNVIAAAEQAGVGRIVYTSILKGDASPMLLAQDHSATEAALAASSLTATVLRNGWYFENYTGALAGAIEAGAIVGVNAAARIAPAARADFAEAIAVVAADDAHAGKVYELAGDEAFTMAEFAAEVAAQAGKPVAYAPMPQAAYADLLKSFGLPEGAAMIFADSDAQAGEGALLDESHTLSHLIGHPTTPLKDAVAAALA